MDVVATDVERYSDPNAFAREVNLPLLGSAALPPVRPGATLSELLAASSVGGLEPIVENLAQTRQSLTLRSLLLAGFPHDPECFALGLALGRAWSRRGLKVAVVDLDGWNPTIVRGVGEPAEGLVDVLEYGCSFQRVAWELVAGSLWVVGPGMHPAEESRLADHPEWDRAARVFAARVDVTLYVAPLLHKPGLTGRLSKRMDGVLLTASVDRVTRVELRDAFLELWGSDAPIIGCVAIDPRAARPTAAEAAPSPAFARVSSFDEEPRDRDRGRAAAPPATPATSATETPAYDAVEADAGESALMAALDREVRLGAVAESAHRHRRADWIWRGLAAAVVVLAGVAAWIGFLAPTEQRADSRGTRPTGEETVLPAPETTPPAEPPPAASTTPAGATTPARPSPVTAGLGAGSSALPPAVAAGGDGAAAAGTGTLGAGASLTTAPPADGKKFRVHVASFRSVEKVAPIVRDLRLKGLDAWYESASDAPGWYRVFVGRFATEDEAKAYATWLLQNQWVERAHAFPSTSR
ncbi:MAG TPA: SPOR domain-containing protein [Candidatus Eisenbacteria bacterium]|nr:SPOR domain-containing protein [Candidatus Eisenbacteria bacterium]